MTLSLKRETHQADTVPGSGSFTCLGCGTGIVVNALETLPPCPDCGGEMFKRASMFEQGTPHEPPTVETPVEADEAASDWLAAAREDIDGEGHFVAYCEPDGDVVTIPLDEGWSRIGRSEVADIKLDDPTVSRRHALLVREEGEVRLLDDRSLNGVFVNGLRVDWRILNDDDELAIGRFRLHFIEI